ncbi:MAG: hypothetical protein PHI85_08070 [Victivallaceae bacterium]|nr:hypothetical protein [Victivallaceae bacterium]
MVSCPFFRAALLAGVSAVVGLSGCSAGKTGEPALAADAASPAVSCVAGDVSGADIPAAPDPVLPTEAKKAVVVAVGSDPMVWRLSRSDGFHVNGMDDFTVTAVYMRPSADFEPSGLRSILNWDFSAAAASRAGGRVSSAGGRFLFHLASPDAGMDALAVLDASIDFQAAGPERFTAFAASGTLMKLFVNGDLVFTADRPASGSPVLLESAVFELRPGRNPIRLLLALPAGSRESAGRLLIAPKDGGSPWFLEKMGVKP